MTGWEQLKLENQLCFPLYAASRLVIREYQPHLVRLGLTYPQYLVLMLLWERDGQAVSEIAHKLVLNTNTITPLLKRMEVLGILLRRRSGQDERKVIVELTPHGHELRTKARDVPFILMEKITSGTLKVEELIRLKGNLERVIELLGKGE